MDIVSHAAWGYIALRWKGKKEGYLGALAGAAPDLFYAIPDTIDRVSKQGLSGIPNKAASIPGVWSADGPPMPQVLIDSYHNYYVYTHSFVILGAAMFIAYLLNRKSWLWFGISLCVSYLVGYSHTREVFDEVSLSFVRLHVSRGKLGRALYLLAKLVFDPSRPPVLRPEKAFDGGYIVRL